MVDVPYIYPVLKHFGAFSISLRIFIVNPAKEEVWSAIPERWDTREKRWTIISQYRANIIYKKEDLARIIFKGEAYPISETK